MNARIYILSLLTFIMSCHVAMAQESGDTIPAGEGATVTASAQTVTSDQAVTPEMAAQAYRDQDYKRSIELYETLIQAELDDHRESAQLYYNLGNAYFRDNQLGKAILNYERAHLLDPGDGDIRHNLRFANNRTEDRIIPASNLFLTNWFRGVRDLFSSNT